MPFGYQILVRTLFMGHYCDSLNMYMYYLNMYYLCATATCTLGYYLCAIATCTLGPIHVKLELSCRRVAHL